VVLDSILNDCDRKEDFMDLSINQLFQWCDEGARIERILWIEHEGQRLATIDVEDKQAWPSYVDRPTLEHHIASGAIRLLDKDMYGYLRQPDEAFTLSHIKQRDKAWKVIEDIFAHQEVEGPSDGAIFHLSILGPLVQAAMEKTGYSKQRVHTYLRYYWQRGQIKNAPLPEFDHRDTQGKEHQSPDRHARKRGRSSYVAKFTGVSTGVNIDDTIKEYFRRGTKLFYENAGKMPMTQAFKRILTLFFHQGYELRNGVLVPLLPPAAELPTFNQYRYWYTKERDLTRSIAVGDGLHACEIQGGACLEHLRQMIPGPGYLFEIHVVVGDIFLVSLLDRRRIIGRPVIYIIDDVFSDLIAGMSVSLEGPSWQGAMLALENAARDKVTFCQEFGIDITEDDWPSHHLPKAILIGDGLIPKSANNLVDALDIEISYTPPYRLDWKEFFERSFPVLDDVMIHWAPGSATNLPEPGRNRHRLDACLTLHDFRRLLINCIVEHNMAHHLSNDHLDGDMIADGVEPYPRDIWKWGIQNRSGVLRALSIDEACRNFLLEAEASVTQEGICFHQLHYTCGRAIQERWFEQVRAGMKGVLTIPILYDPRTPDRIYLRLQESQPLEICWLLEKDRAMFKGCDWFDIEEMIAHSKILMTTDKRDRQRRVELIAMRDRIIEEAQRRMGEVRENRTAEKVQEREMNTWDVQELAASDTGQSQPVFKGLVERFFALDNDKLFH
jgi:hypothetical protein